MPGLDMGGTDHPMTMPNFHGDVDHQANGFDPSATLTDFDYGALSTLPNGQTLREFEINAINKEIEIAPGLMFPVWVYNGRILRVTEGDRVRIYLVNILEFDPVNSFHLHANFFNFFPTGTSLTPTEYTDTIIQGQAQRAILEFRYKYPGEYMFHAYQTEFAELGWAGLFNVPLPAMRCWQDLVILLAGIVTLSIACRYPPCHRCRQDTFYFSRKGCHS